MLNARLDFDLSSSSSEPCVPQLNGLGFSLAILHNLRQSTPLSYILLIIPNRF